MSILGIVLATLVACTSKESDTSVVERSTFEITNTSVSSTDCGGEPTADIFTATVEAGVVQVLHENYEESSCLSFEVEGELDGSNLDLSYTKSGEECDCIDMYRLEYHIEGLEAGSYTVNAPGGMSASVVIE